MGAQLKIQCAQCGEIFVLKKAEREELESKRRKISKYCPICRKAYRIKTQKEKEEIQKIENDKAWKIKHEKDLKVFEEKLLKWNVVTLDGAKPGGNERVLYAIGNGFDIMHRVKSSYADFGKTLGKNSNLRFYLENYLDVDDLWGDFEGEADDDLTKDCSEIIKKHKEFFDKTIDADHVITIGHSLYPVDWEYFAEVLNTVKDKDKLKWTFGCYSAADLERVESFVSEHNIPFDNIRIYRTDLISTTPKPVIENEDAISGEKIFIRVFSSIINEAVFDKSGNTLLLIIRRLFDGVFLVRFVDDKWSYIKELEGIPNQGVINRRLRKIILEQNHLTFVYNSRVRKYSLSDGALIYNRGVRGAAEHEYVGEVIMDKFYK